MRVKQLMKTNIFYDEDIKFELRVIGYREKGESILFFIKVDSNIVYAGLVDCYDNGMGNIALDIMDNNHVAYFDFVCWTHPHDDHTMGMKDVLIKYCNEDTHFFMPDIIKADINQFGVHSRAVYEELFEIINSLKKRKISIRTVQDSQNMMKLIFKCKKSGPSYQFLITSFAPDSKILLEQGVRNNKLKANQYSIGLFINFGHFMILLGGDVEDRTLANIPLHYYCNNVDYIKIPHHASKSSEKLIDILKENNVLPPVISTTTLFKKYNLPNIKVLEKYKKWGNNMKIYSVGNVDYSNEGDYGMIITSFDITEKDKVSIITTLKGNACKV